MTPTMPWPEDILAYQPLVAAVAGEFKGISAFDRDDLLSEGMIGLAKGLCRGGESKADPVAFLKTSARNAMKSWLSWRDGASRRTGLRRWRGANTAPLLAPLCTSPPRIDEPLVNDLLAAIEGDSSLTPREQSVMRLLFGVGDQSPTPPIEVARLLGTTQRSVHRARERAANKLRMRVEGESP